jgi:hypothetical protein
LSFRGDVHSGSQHPLTAIRTKGSTVRRLMRSTQEALRFIDTALTAEQRSQARWKFARELLVVAERSEKRRDLVCAHRQLCQALRNDSLLHEE